MAELYKEKKFRKVVLDTETTGKNEDGTPGDHRIVEIGCVELEGRKPTGRKLQLYVNPERGVDEEAFRVHGISDEFLRSQPKFAEVCGEFCDFISGAELIIHNAAFDVGFIDNEFRLCRRPFAVEDICAVTDTLALARQKYPGQRVSLDALCAKLGVDRSARTTHGALLDAEILAEVFLAMTGGQGELDFAEASAAAPGGAAERREAAGAVKIPVLYPSVDEEGDDLLYRMKLGQIKIAPAGGKLSRADCVAALRRFYFDGRKFAEYQDRKAAAILDEIDKRETLTDVYARAERAAAARRKKNAG